MASDILVVNREKLVVYRVKGGLTAIKHLYLYDICSNDKLCLCLCQSRHYGSSRKADNTSSKYSYSPVVKTTAKHLVILLISDPVCNNKLVEVRSSAQLPKISRSRIVVLVLIIRIEILSVFPVIALNLSSGLVCTFHGLEVHVGELGSTNSRDP